MIFCPKLAENLKKLLFEIWLEISSFYGMKIGKSIIFFLISFDFQRIWLKIWRFIKQISIEKTRVFSKNNPGFRGGLNPPGGTLHVSFMAQGSKV